MIFLEHDKEFFVKATMHAKKLKMKEINQLETDLIIAEDLLHQLETKGMEKQKANLFYDQISHIRITLKEKKLRLIL